MAGPIFTVEFEESFDHQPIKCQVFSGGDLWIFGDEDVNVVIPADILQRLAYESAMTRFHGETTAHARSKL